MTRRKQPTEEEEECSRPRSKEEHSKLGMCSARSRNVTEGRVKRGDQIKISEGLTGKNFGFHFLKYYGSLLEDFKEKVK